MSSNANSMSIPVNPTYFSLFIHSDTCQAVLRRRKEIEDRMVDMIYVDKNSTLTAVELRLSYQGITHTMNKKMVADHHPKLIDEGYESYAPPKYSLSIPSETGECELGRSTRKFIRFLEKDIMEHKTLNAIPGVGTSAIIQLRKAGIRNLRDLLRIYCNQKKGGRNGAVMGRWLIDNIGMRRRQAFECAFAIDENIRKFRNLH